MVGRPTTSHPHNLNFLHSHVTAAPQVYRGAEQAVQLTQVLDRQQLLQGHVSCDASTSRTHSRKYDASMTLWHLCRHHIAAGMAYHCTSYPCTHGMLATGVTHGPSLGSTRRNGSRTYVSRSVQVKSGLDQAGWESRGHVGTLDQTL